MSEVVGGLVRRIRIDELQRRHSSVAVMGLFALINGCLSIGLMSAAALLTGQPLIFPSLGPTAFLLFYSPRAEAASPRNTLLGHLVGVVCGYGALLVFGLLDAGPVIGEGVSAARVGAAAVSLGGTAGLMAWLRIPHPPAGATTLIISLGFMTEPRHLITLMLAVVALVGQALVINRLAGIPYPFWRDPPRSSEGGGSAST